MADRARRVSATAEADAAVIKFLDQEVVSRADDQVGDAPVRRPAAGAPTRRRAGESDDRQPCAILRLVVRHVSPAVRPDDVLTALHVVASLTPPVPPKVTRLAQGPLVQESGVVADPLAADRVALKPPSGRLCPPAKSACGHDQTSPDRRCSTASSPESV